MTLNKPLDPAISEFENNGWHYTFIQHLGYVTIMCDNKVIGRRKTLIQAEMACRFLSEVEI